MSSRDLIRPQTIEHDYRSSEYLQAILNACNDQAIISTDINGYVLSCSVGTRSVFRIPHEDIPGRDILTLFSDPVFQRELAVHIAACDPTALERAKIAQTAGRLTWYLDVTFQRVNDGTAHPLGYLCIARDVTERVTLRENLKAASITDDLTGLYNQKHLFTTLQAELARSRTSKRSFMIAFFDLDGLKQFNESHGHLKGTEAIREAARLVRTTMREGVDLGFRYGGDEYVIFMPEITRLKARTAIEKLRVRIGELFHGKITASFGMAESKGCTGPQDLIRRANQAMYWAKTQGKNRVVLWE